MVNQLKIGRSVILQNKWQMENQGIWGGLSFVVRIELFKTEVKDKQVFYFTKFIFLMQQWVLPLLK